MDRDAEVPARPDKGHDELDRYLSRDVGPEQGHYQVPEPTEESQPARVKIIYWIVCAVGIKVQSLRGNKAPKEKPTFFVPAVPRVVAVSPVCLLTIIS